MDERKGARPQINPEHKGVLDKLRVLYTESGAKLYETPEDHGGADPKERKTEGDTIELSFDYGVPHRLHTSEGGYLVMGNHTAGDTNKFWQKLNEEFDVEVVKPQRNDAETLRRSELEFQLQVSGPVVRLHPKQK